MKKIITVALILLFATGMLYAQAAKEGLKFGLGVSFGKEPVIDLDTGFITGSLDFPSFYVPIQVSPAIRIEPELAYFKYSLSNSYSITETVLMYGAGIFYTKWYGKCDLYMGGRIQLYNLSYKEEYGGIESEVTRSDMVISPAVGGECWCCDHISFGGELQFNYYNVGEEEYDPKPAQVDREDISESIMKFKGLLFIRWWF